MIFNAYILVQYNSGKAFDPYPFILLNLVLSSLAAIQAPVILMSQNRQAERDRAKAESPLLNYYQCGDGKWICFGCPWPDKYWSDFCKIVGIEDLEKDPRFANMDVRSVHSEELISILDQRFALKTRDEWIQLIKESGTGMPWAPVNSVLDLATDPQVLENRYLVDYNHPLLGSIKIPALPVMLSKAEGVARTPPPEFGQHTEEVLLDLCGCSWEEIREMRELGVF